MKYTLVRRNKSFKTNSPQQFVDWMMNNDPAEWDCLDDFLEGYSRRKYCFEKIVIRIDSIQNFIEDLESHNLIIIEKNKSLLSKLFA